MLDLENRLFIFHDDDSSFSDHSIAAQDYSRDEFAVELDKDDDYLYIGHTKPINSVYIEMSTANTNANTFTFQYYKGNADTPAWAAVPKFADESKGMTRNGFLSWERNLTDEGVVTINSQEAYWYRLRPSATHASGTEIQGINSVFSDDNDLKTLVPSIAGSDYYATGASSHILAHVAARDFIIQNLRNDGKLKVDVSTGRISDINIFDVLKIEQLNQASKLKALEIIFDDLSDREDDKWHQKARQFGSMYNFAYGKLQFLNLDTDNDGVSDRHEEMRSASMILVRR
jgi:hypothetical protein